VLTLVLLRILKALAWGLLALLLSILLSYVTRNKVKVDDGRNHARKRAEEPPDRHRAA